MRMWNVDPKCMCRQHLLGSHVELHMFMGAIKKGTSMKGYIDKNLLEPLYIEEYHNMIVNEMVSRGMNHKTPLVVDMEDLNTLCDEHLYYIIDRDKSSEDLFSRCNKCRRIE